MCEAEIEFVMDSETETRHNELIHTLRRVEFALYVLVGLALAFLIDQGWG